MRLHYQVLSFVRRYEEIKAKLTPFLKKVGFNPKTGWYLIWHVMLHLVIFDVESETKLIS